MAILGIYVRFKNDSPKNHPVQDVEWFGFAYNLVMQNFQGCKPGTVPNSKIRKVMIVVIYSIMSSAPLIYLPLAPVQEGVLTEHTSPKPHPTK